MTAPLRNLLSHLPAELRNEVYGYLSSHNADFTPTNHGLPLPLKQYDCKHTSVSVAPVHYGSVGLLALQKYLFLEAHEYHAWLLDNAVELRIRVRFKGKSSTFHQPDWDKKIESHLRKLAKQHPWLHKVARYDVEIHWDAADGMLRGKRKKTAGQMARAMARTLTLLMSEETRRKRGRVVVTLLVAHRIAVQHVLSRLPFGFGDFFAPLPPTACNVGQLILEAWKTPHLVITQDQQGASSHLAVPSSPSPSPSSPSPSSPSPSSPSSSSSSSSSTSLPEKTLAPTSSLEASTASKQDSHTRKNILLMRKTVLANQTTTAVCGDAQLELGAEPDYLLSALIQDCSRE